MFGLAVDAEAALLEYLEMFYKLGRAGGLLERFGAIDFATTIAPGLRDVLLTGKVYEAVAPPASTARAARRTTRSCSTPRPPGGSPASSTSTPRSPGSPRSARSAARPTRSPRCCTSPQTAVHMVTLLEEMPVQETVDASAELRAAGLPVGAVIVNKVREPLLPPPSSPRPARAGCSRLELAAGLPGRGLGRRRRLATALLAEARQHADRVALEQREQRACSAARAADVRAALLPEASTTRLRARRPARRQGVLRRPGRPVSARATPPPRSTSTRCSPTRRPGSSCAAAPAGSARRPPPPHSALRAAEPGRKVVVLTIDPARRLAQSLGLTELDNTPRPVAASTRGRRRRSTR